MAKITKTSGLTNADKANLVDVKDYTDEILAAMDAAKARTFEKIGLVAEGYAKRLCHVITGRLRNSITHTTDGNDVYIGTNVEYAEEEEMGNSKRPPHPYTLYNILQ